MSRHLDAMTLRAHRAILLWGVQSGRMMWREYNQLIKSVRADERVATCKSKERFPNFARAALAATRMNNSHAHRSGGPARPYKCPVCNGFHLTEDDVDMKRAKRRIRRRLEELEYG